MNKTLNIGQLPVEVKYYTHTQIFKRLRGFAWRYQSFSSTTHLWMSHNKSTRRVIYRLVLQNYPSRRKGISHCLETLSKRVASDLIKLNNNGGIPQSSIGMCVQQFFVFSWNVHALREV